MRKLTSSLAAVALCYALSVASAGAQSLSAPSVQPAPAVTNEYVDSISPAGVPHQSQPAFAGISGQWALTQGPTLGANTVLCSIAGGTPIACTQAQLTALLNLATASLPGALPAWPNNTTTYFRGDGTYASLTGAITYADLATAALATQANYFAGASNVVVPASQIYQPEITITFAAAQTIDFSTFINSAITLTANMTSMTLTSTKAGQAGQIRLIQDGTGSRLFSGTWPTTFKWANGIQPTLSTAAGAVDEIEFNCSSSSYCTASFLPNVH